MKADVLCAWCDAFMYAGESWDGEPSHGICPTCVREHFPEVAPSLDLPDPTPIATPSRTYYFAQFFSSPVYHLTTNHQRALCRVRLEGRTPLHYFEAITTNHRPKHGRLCANCRAVIDRRPTN